MPWQTIRMLVKAHAAQKLLKGSALFKPVLVKNKDENHKS